MLRTIALALVLWTPAQPPAQHPLEGVWKITYPWHIDVVNGVVKPVMETGELKVEARGDSLIATLATNPSAQRPQPRPLRLAAVPGSGDVVFVMRDPVTLTIGGTERQVTAVSTWIFRPDGDALQGSLERRMEGTNVPSHGPQALTGSRARF
jgi:hypothetical protein